MPRTAGTGWESVWERNMMTRELRHGCSRQSRRRVRLAAGMEKSLSAYASAAIASGVSLLALTNSAEAKIVYTPTDTNIPIDNADYVPLDLNHDGIVDFLFRNLDYNGSADSLAVGCGLIRVSSGNSTCRYQRNQIWGRGGRFASALRGGFAVGTNKSYFQQGGEPKGQPGRLAEMAIVFGSIFGAYSYSGTGGQWMYTKNRYLGLKFIIGGQIHYGWARLNVIKGPVFQATLTGYAYETIPNKPIITGKTTGPDVITLEPVIEASTLGHLAQGASGISAWREKK
jgi:hypothetical protein